MEHIPTQRVSAKQLQEIRDRYQTRKRKSKVILIVTGVLFFVVSGLVGGFLTYLYHTLPPLSMLEENRPSMITSILSDNGSVIGEFFVERRIILGQSQIPKLIKDAIIATEDNLFYKHPGIDFAGILRAFIKNILAGRIVQGGSTITQQLTKILFLTPEQTVLRKLKEAMLAFQIEHHYTKDEILALYLNQIYFGEGAYGIEAAALTYFNKKAEELDLSEVALLCGIPKAPSHYSPFKNSEKSMTRRNLVLRRMLEVGIIKPGEYERAIELKPKLAPPGRKLTIGPYFIEEVRKYLDRNYGSDVLYRDGLKVVSTLNVDLQLAAEHAVRKGLRHLTIRQGYKPFKSSAECIEELARLKEIYTDLERVRVGVVTEVTAKELRIKADNTVYLLDQDDASHITVWRGSLRAIFSTGDHVLITLPENKTDKDKRVELYLEPEAEAALVCIEVGTGNIKAMVGGYSFERSKFNRATQALRQVGSAFKMFVYLAAIDNGFSPSMIVNDEPYTYVDPQTRKKYSPKNHSKEFLGPITMTTALAQSINIPAVKLLEQLKAETVIDYARRMGITSPLPPYLSLALGASEISLAELTNAYAVLPNAGVWKEMKMVQYISDRENQLLEQKIGNIKDIISSEVAYVMTSMLEASVQRGTCWRARGLKRAVAAKTGTTDEYTDAWFIGYSPDLVTGVWVGFDKKKSLGPDETGSRAAAPIWVDFMHKALAQAADRSFLIPTDIVLLDVDVDSGLLYRQECRAREVAAFIRGTEPTEYCISR